MFVILLLSLCCLFHGSVQQNPIKQDVNEAYIQFTSIYLQSEPFSEYFFAVELTYLSFEEPHHLSNQPLINDQTFNDCWCLNTTLKQSFPSPSDLPEIFQGLRVFYHMMDEIHWEDIDALRPEEEETKKNITKEEAEKILELFKRKYNTPQATIDQTMKHVYFIDNPITDQTSRIPSSFYGLVVYSYAPEDMKVTKKDAERILETFKKEYGFGDASLSRNEHFQYCIINLIYGDALAPPIYHDMEVFNVFVRKDNHPLPPRNREHDHSHHHDDVSSEEEDSEISFSDYLQGRPVLMLCIVFQIALFGVIVYKMYSARKQEEIYEPVIQSAPSVVYVMEQPSYFPNYRPIYMQTIGDIEEGN